MLGSVFIVALGAFATTQGRSSSATKTTASWGLYTPAGWASVRSGLARRGFVSSSVHVVTGTALANGQPFALIGGRSHEGRSCFAVARGTSLGGTICHLSKPVTVFLAGTTRTMLALVRGDVTVTMIRGGHESGIGVVPAGKDFAFNTSPVGHGDQLRARDAHGHVLANIRF